MFTERVCRHRPPAPTSSVWEDASLSTDFPIGLSLTVAGFLLILLVERVIFDVHRLERRT
jgi:hypothetical protein